MPATIAIVALSARGAALAGRLADRVSSEAVLYLDRRFAAQAKCGPEIEPRLFDLPLRPLLRRVWQEHRAVVLFLPVGAAVRLVAPMLEDKRSDPCPGLRGRRGPVCGKRAVGAPWRRRRPGAAGRCRPGSGSGGNVGFPRHRDAGRRPDGQGVRLDYRGGLDSRHPAPAQRWSTESRWACSRTLESRTGGPPEKRPERPEPPASQHRGSRLAGITGPVGLLCGFGHNRPGGPASPIGRYACRSASPRSRRPVPSPQPCGGDGLPQGSPGGGTRKPAVGHVPGQQPVLASLACLASATLKQDEPGLAELAGKHGVPFHCYTPPTNSTPYSTPTQPRHPTRAAATRGLPAWTGDKRRSAGLAPVGQCADAGGRLGRSRAGGPAGIRRRAPVGVEANGGPRHHRRRPASNSRRARPGR